MLPTSLSTSKEKNCLAIIDTRVYQSSQVSQWLAKAHGRYFIAILTESEVYVRCQWCTLSDERCTSYISICVNLFIDSVSSSKKVTAILSIWLKFHYAHLWLLFLLLNALNDKNPKIASTGDASWGESAFTFLSDVISLLGRATHLPLAPLSLSPWQLLLSIARYLCYLEKAAALTSRSRRHFFFLVFDLSLLALSKILSHLLSFHRPTFGVASCLAASYIFARLHPRVWHFFHRLI